MRIRKNLDFNQLARWGLLVVLFLLVLILPGQSARAQADFDKLITIYDNGVRRTVYTNKSTVKEVLEQSDIRLEVTDLVEPNLDQPVLDTDFHINIYRSKPVVVVDGNKRIKTFSPYQLGRQIVKHAGVKLYAEDQVEAVINFDKISEGVGVEYVIKRATPFELVFFGKKIPSRTVATTVEEYLKQKNIELGPKDKLNLDLKTKIKPGLKLEIWREGRQEITVEEEIKFSTRQIRDHNRPAGYKKVKTPGKNGQKVVTYQVTIKNGKEAARKKIKQVIVKEATEQVEIVGVKVKLPSGSHQDWMRQAGIAESDFGYVQFIIKHESGWGYTKWNYSGSGAYGLCQALPASKMRSAGADYMTNPITQLKWCNGYAVGRYGSWANAYNFWTRNHWW